MNISKEKVRKEENRGFLRVYVLLPIIQIFPIFVLLGIAGSICLVFKGWEISNALLYSLLMTAGEGTAGLATIIFISTIKLIKYRRKRAE